MGVAAAGQKKPDIPQPQIGTITIDQFRRLEGNTEGYFKSPGPVRIILEDAVTGEKTVIIADDAEGQPNGDIVVHGAVRVERVQGTLTGRSLEYHGADQTGTILQAKVESGTMTLTGRKVDLLPGHVIKAYDASVTTCIRPNPHYHITAKQIQVSPNGKVNAKNVTIWLGRTRIISLPSVQKNFSSGSGGSLPLPGYSASAGVHIRYSDQALPGPGKSLDYEALLAVKQAPAGFIEYQQEIGPGAATAPPPRMVAITANMPLLTALERTPPPTLRSIADAIDTRKRTSLFAMLQANLPVYNRLRSDLRLSRLPQMGIRMTNLLGRTPPPGNELAQPLAGARYREWMVNAEASFGYLTESPTHARAARLGMRADAAGPFTPLGGGLHLRYGGTIWANAYSGGNGYLLAAPEVELDYLLSKNSLLGARYRYEQAYGIYPVCVRPPRCAARRPIALRISELELGGRCDGGLRLGEEAGLRQHAVCSPTPGLPGVWTGL